MEYLGIKGNNSYLIDLKSGEGYVFSTFGASIEKVKAEYVISICKNMKRVNILSILNDPTSKVSEIYYMGKKALINKTGMELYRVIPSNFQRESCSIYRIVRQDCIGLVQLLIPFTYGTVSFDMVDNLYGNPQWV